MDTMKLDFNKFIKKLKELNSKHGYKSMPEDVDKTTVWRVAGYQECLGDVIDIFKECMKTEEKKED